MKNHATTISKLCLLLTLIPCLIQCAEEDYFIPFVTRSNCLSGSDDIFHQFYDFSQLICSNCNQNSTAQTISEDG